MRQLSCHLSHQTQPALHFVPTRKLFSKTDLTNASGFYVNCRSDPSIKLLFCFSKYVRCEARHRGLFTSGGCMQSDKYKWYSKFTNSQSKSYYRSLLSSCLHQTEKYFKAVESVSSCSTHYLEKREDLLVILNLLQLQTQSSFPFSLPLRHFTSLHQPEVSSGSTFTEDPTLMNLNQQKPVQLIRDEDKQDQRVKYGLFLHHMFTCKKITG